ncbi:hypothetical protein SAMN04488503_2534 [Humidesulfovibrio mexicanus]|uniref:Probable sensor domain-containing protein n=1 Tax=Humidesulfovibrio mexicanus TaxID=147047 RepID=A0A239BFT0_9BACT|nr:hypothetical protein [Humidesulfovibrio mexicanus]SNS06569.1 hypothetical protein SAMN04488503_2534 [Humidesulfovibrio mexicanus]
MDSCIFPVDSVFIDALRRAVGPAPGDTPADRAQALLADAAQLAQLCSDCFWASLEQEEGRQVRGAIALCSPSASLLARSFTRPVPVSVKNLVELLTASPRSPLAVHGGAEGLEVWGIVDSEPEGGTRLRIAGNGKLLASRAGQVLALMHQGEVSIPVASDEASLAQLVARTLGMERALEQHANVPGRLIRIVSTMIRHGHGGSLVLTLPEDDSWRSAVSFRFCFDEASARVLYDSVRNFETMADEAKRGYDDLVSGRTGCDSLITLRERFEAVSFLRGLSESLFRRIGELGLVDGAVVMDMELRLYGFGAKLLYGPEEFDVATLDAVTGRLRKHVPLAELGGMRHQSAARFVNANRACDVFVASQDGRLSMFTWADVLQGVAVVQHLEHFLWEQQEG